MKVLIVGLGIIGGSYAKGLMKKGYEVYGVDKDLKTLEYALKEKYIVKGDTDPEVFLREVDMLILGLYPHAILPFLSKYQPYFRDDLIITDTCGIKTSICYEATKISKPASFVGSHPMAGREKVGVFYADEKIFTGTNFLICPIEETNPFAIEKVKEIANALEFGKIHLITPEHHDEMIAYTSQLTHAIAVSLVNSETGCDVTSFIGDSYRDLTRIAMINESLWSQLFLDNKEALLHQMELFEEQLDIIKSALSSDNLELLKERFVSSKEKREVM